MTGSSPSTSPRGSAIGACYRGETDGSVYFRRRRFSREEERVGLYKDVHESDHWQNRLAPRVGQMIDRETIGVRRVVPMTPSALQ